MEVEFHGIGLLYDCTRTAYTFTVVSAVSQYEKLAILRSQSSTFW